MTRTERVRRPPTQGFENFDTKNEFEQLLINFTNESLQDTFNKQVFNNELKLYREEGIDVQVSSCPDNAQCLAMLSDRPKGIIPRYVLYVWSLRVPLSPFKGKILARQSR